MEDPRSRWGDPDPYQVLGVPTDASGQDIARAYRRAAQSAHPDAQPDDPQAATRFRALTDAYATLSDPGRRADYHRKHPGHTDPGQPADPGVAPGAPRQGAAGPPFGQPIWAGPVHVQPPGVARTEQGQERAEQGREGAATGPAHHRDPDVYLGWRPPAAWGWPW